MSDGADERAERKTVVAWILVALVTVGTRLLTSINYVADPDSLRFALGLRDFDLVALQPHFPGYPVFIALAKLIDLFGLPLGTTFALTGSAATLLLIWGFLRLVRTRIDAPEGVLGAFLILFTPMIWLMGTRFMPDLLGTSVALTAIVLLVRRDYQTSSLLVLGAGLVGLLGGIRLSYLPLLLIPLLVGFIRSEVRFAMVLALFTGILLWFVPMALDTGFTDLVRTAEVQAAGHFGDFGGTVETVPGLDARRVAVIEGIVADGFGGYWTGRSWLTVLTLVGFVILFSRGVWEIFLREPEGLVITILGMAIYVAWILLYQNVVYQPRHVLPLLPLLLAPIWAGAVQLLSRPGVGRALVTGTLAVLAFTSTYLALQQTTPTAIARISETMRSEWPAELQERSVRSTRLICWFLIATGVNFECEPVEEGHAGSRVDTAEDPAFIVGWFIREEEVGRYRKRTFHHNPYVNAIWPEVPLFVRRDLTAPHHARGFPDPE